MKLTKLALPLAVAFGVAVVGGSWYTGKEAETRYNELVTLGNHHLKELQIYGVQAEIKDVKLDRGLFSSQVSYQVDVNYNGENSQFSGNDTLFHGPFPLNRLKQGNLAPTMLSVETTLTPPQTLAPRFTQAHALSGVSNIDYSGQVDSKLQLTGFKTPESELTVADTQISYKSNPATKQVEAKLNVPSAEMLDEMEDTKITFSDIEYTFTNTAQDNPYPLLSQGNFNFVSKSVSISPLNPSDESLEQLSFNDLKLIGSGKLLDSRYESEGKFSSKLNVKNQGAEVELANLNFDLFFNMDAAALNKVSEYSTSPEQMQTPAFMESAQALLSKAPQLHLKSFTLENAKGKNEFNLLVNLNEFNLNELNDFAQILSLFKQSSLETTLNIASLEELSKQAKLLNPADREQAEQIAKQEIAALVDEIRNTGVAVIDNDNIKIKLEIDNGKVKLNGNELPEEQVQSALFMLILGLGSLDF